MAPKKDVRSRFSVKENESKRSRISILKITTIATDNASQAEVDMAKEEVNKESTKRQKYQNVPEKDRTGQKLQSIITPKVTPSTT